MKWLDRKIDDFIRRVRDANPVGVDPKNPIAIGGKKVLIGNPPQPGAGSNDVGAAFKIENPTYWRWYVWPRNRFINCYLHNFLRDDEEDLHDHRMINISVVLSRIGYREELYLHMPASGMPLPGTYMKRVEFMRPRLRLPSTPHRVVLHKDTFNKPQAIWSLFIGFPHWRDWGFWCPGVRNEDGTYRGQARWVPWEEYVLGGAFGAPPGKRARANPTSSRAASEPARSPLANATSTRRNCPAPLAALAPTTAVPLALRRSGDARLLERAQ